MKRTCKQCRHANPPHASFCAACGGPLSRPAQASYAAPPAATPKDKCGRQARGGCLAACALTIIAAACVLVVFKADGTRELNFTLDSHLADAMFELLAPADVDVVVSRRTKGIHIKGSPQDIRTVARFIAVVTQNTHHPNDPPRAISSHWLEDRTYILTRHNADSLVEVLAYEHAPVFATQFGSKVEISASPEDHKAIAAMIDVLGGRPTPPIGTSW